jgi:hypothetical protein
MLAHLAKREEGTGECFMSRRANARDGRWLETPAVSRLFECLGEIANAIGDKKRQPGVQGLDNGKWVRIVKGRKEKEVSSCIETRHSVVRDGWKDPDDTAQASLFDESLDLPAERTITEKGERPTVQILLIDSSQEGDDSFGWDQPGRPEG